MCLHEKKHKIIRPISTFFASLRLENIVKINNLH